MRVGLAGRCGRRWPALAVMTARACGWEWLVRRRRRRRRRRRGRRRGRGRAASGRGPGGVARRGGRCDGPRGGIERCRFVDRRPGSQAVKVLPAAAHAPGRQLRGSRGVGRAVCTLRERPAVPVPVPVPVPKGGSAVLARSCPSVLREDDVLVRGGNRRWREHDWVGPVEGAGVGPFLARPAGRGCGAGARAEQHAAARCPAARHRRGEGGGSLGHLPEEQVGPHAGRADGRRGRQQLCHAERPRRGWRAVA
mmetsp:Transcript_18711/g.71151  ORF Transcript_18711/g.71151 Transcript_18711/m.71151 type:complete len:252 (+) Transcript_18711:3225-3980(+)